MTSSDIQIKMTHILTVYTRLTTFMHKVFPKKNPSLTYEAIKIHKILKGLQHFFIIFTFKDWKISLLNIFKTLNQKLHFAWRMTMKPTDNTAHKNISTGIYVVFSEYFQYSHLQLLRHYFLVYTESYGIVQNWGLKIITKQFVANIINKLTNSNAALN